MACFSNPNQPGPSVPPAFRRYENFIPPDPPKLMALNDYSFLDTANRSSKSCNFLLLNDESFSY